MAKMENVLSYADFLKFFTILANTIIQSEHFII